MGEIVFEQSKRGIPRVKRMDDGSYELWFTAFDAEGMEQEVLINVPVSVWLDFTDALDDANASRNVNIIAADPSLGVSVLEKAYDMGGDVVNAWDVFVAAVGRAEAGRLVKEKLGEEKGHAVLAAIKGQS